MAEEQTDIAIEVSRITTARNAIRAKFSSLGIAASGADIDDLATAAEGIVNQGAISADVQEGETYTIPAGYHNGSGTVSGVAGGGNYSLQSKSVIPTKTQQAITSDAGYYGLSDVTVEPIPDTYQDVTSVTAAAADVLASKVYVTSAGQVTTGTMPNNGAVSKTLDTGTTAYTVPKGYHNGSGKVQIVNETKTVTPTEAAQEITPSAGKVLSKVTVAAIPEAYITTDDATAAAGDILTGKTAYVDGVKVSGSMPDNTGKGLKVNPNSNKTGSGGSYSHSVAIPAGYHSGGGAATVQSTDLTVTPAKSTQTFDPVDDNNNKFYCGVTVNPIPAEYVSTEDATATAAQILTGSTAYVKKSKVTGTMPNNGALALSFDALTETGVAVPAGYTSGGTVSLTSDLLDALRAI